MQKNIVIAVLVTLVALMWLWPTKHQQPIKDALPPDNRSYQNPYSDINNPVVPQTRPHQAPLDFQGYPTQNGSYAPPSAPEMPYGNSYTQPWLYNSQQSPFGQSGGIPMYPQTYPPQQPYTSNGLGYPQYYTPRYRFRDHTNMETPNRYSPQDEPENDRLPAPTPNPSLDDNSYQRTNPDDSDQPPARYTSPQTQDRYLRY